MHIHVLNITSLIACAFQKVMRNVLGRNIPEYEPSSFRVCLERLNLGELRFVHWETKGNVHTIITVASFSYTHHSAYGICIMCAHMGIRQLHVVHVCVCVCWRMWWRSVKVVSHSWMRTQPFRKRKPPSYTPLPQGSVVSN